MKAFNIFPFQIAVNLRSIFWIEIDIRERCWISIQDIQKLDSRHSKLKNNYNMHSGKQNGLNNFPIGIRFLQCVEETSFMENHKFNNLMLWYHMLVIDSIHLYSMNLLRIVRILESMIPSYSLKVSRIYLNPWKT